MLRRLGEEREQRHSLMARRTHRELQLRIHASAECVGHGRGVVDKQKVEAARCFEAPGQRDMVFAGPPVSALGAIVCGRPRSEQRRAGKECVRTGRNRLTQKPAYEMRISDWSSDVCSSDLASPWRGAGAAA